MIKNSCLFYSFTTDIHCYSDKHYSGDSKLIFCDYIFCEIGNFSKILVYTKTIHRSHANGEMWWSDNSKLVCVIYFCHSIVFHTFPSLILESSHGFWTYVILYSNALCKPLMPSLRAKTVHLSYRIERYRTPLYVSHITIIHTPPIFFDDPKEQYNLRAGNY